MIERSLLAALCLGLLASASAAGQGAADAPTREEVEAALDAGDYERAHALIAELLLAQRLDRAAAHLAEDQPEEAWRTVQSALELSPRSARARALRAELAEVLLARWLDEARAAVLAGEPRDAMVVLDEALALGPEDPEVHFLRGECALRMGVEDGDVLAFDDARKSFLAAVAGGAVPEAWSGAGRALFQSYFASGNREDLERALDFARRGREGTPDGSARVALMSSPPLDTLAQVAFYAYLAAKQAPDEPELVAARFEECRGAYEARIGEAPDEPAAWLGLANLFQWELRNDEARELLLRALSIAPERPALHEKLIEVERGRGGSDAAIATYTEWVAARPEVALGRWWLGVETMERAIAGLLAGDYEQDAAFRAAEAELARSAELDPARAESAAGHRAICRAGVGWCHYHRGELDAARDAFLSMEDCLEGGLFWEYPEKLPSGVKSLGLVVGRYMERAGGEDLPVAERDAALVKAAEVATALHRHQPENADAANDAGFLNRDAGVLLQQRGELLLRRSLGDRGEAAPDEERAAQRAEAEALFARAREHAEASYAAYAAAAALAPRDARIQNDAGLVLVHYLQRELDVAERYLLRAIEAGTAQLEAGVRDEAARKALTEAVGDAHENMGVLLLTLRGDAAGAIPWFEKSLAIGPLPRPPVEHRHLPLCRKVLDGGADVGMVQQASYWGALETERVLERIRAERRVRELLP